MGRDKKSIVEYARGRATLKADAVLDMLSRNQDALKPGAVADDALQLLLASVQNVDDAVWAAHIVRSYADRQSPRVFEVVARLLEQVEMDLPGGWGERVRTVTVLSSVTDGHHLKLLFAHAAALLTQPDLARVDIVFTGEWTWHLWQNGGSSKFRLSMLEEFSKQLAMYPGIEVPDVSGRLAIHVAPRPSELAQLLGDVVLRFEGPAAFKTTFICGRSIHLARPVVTGTFSSHVTAGRNSDFTLTRSAAPGNGAVHFVPPAGMALPISAPSRTAASRLLVTVYSQDRIRKGLQALPSEAWVQIRRLLEQMPDATWTLIGAADPAAARAAFPEGFLQAFGHRVQVLAFSDLREIYPKAFAFLALPNVFGGAGGATMAIASGLPVVACRDRKSDISNTLPDNLQTDNLAESVDLLLRWSDDGQRRRFIMEQQRCLRERMDLRQKGKELLAVLQHALRRRSETAAGALATDRGEARGPARASGAGPVRQGGAGAAPVRRPLRRQAASLPATDRPKVFCIGRNKTGTTSMMQALKALGFHVAGQTGAAAYIADWKRRDFRGLVEFCKKADAFQDMPFSLDFTFQALDAAFPGAKFILTVRDSPQQWFESVTRFHSKIVGAAGVPPTAEELRRFRGGWLLTSQKMIYGVGEDDVYDPAIYMAHYEAYNARIIEYFKFRPDDLLVLNVGRPDAMQQLCGFLGIEFRNQKFPHANKTATAAQRA